jgi:D-sedoheptulose 7-phosphate isomerase
LAKQVAREPKPASPHLAPRPPRGTGREVSLAMASIQKSIETKQRLSSECLDEIVEVAREVTKALREGRRVAFFGNGGSAADAQHIAAELVGKFRRERPPLNALALTSNTSILTAIGNDFDFAEIFSRQIQANLEEGDIAVGISTSGRSKNVILGVQEAKKIGAKTIALTGGDGGQLAPVCDLKVIVPSNDTQRIQECHIMIGHIVCELIDDSLGSNKLD